jgi:hypothetical protein
MRGTQMSAAELAAVIRRRFPQASASLEADLSACEDAAWGETIAAPEALKLIQSLHGHSTQLKEATGTGSQKRSQAAQGGHS